MPFNIACRLGRIILSKNETFMCFFGGGGTTLRIISLACSVNQSIMKVVAGPNFNKANATPEYHEISSNEMPLNSREHLNANPSSGRLLNVVIG